MFSAPLTTDFETLLQPVKTAPDSVTLEIFQVRIPAGNDELAEEFWRPVDEQRLDVEVRRDLVRNGFRVGVLGGALPDVLARHLNLQSEMPETTAERVITGESADPRVVRRVIQLNHRKTATLQASDLQDQLLAMINDDNGLQGDIYHQVQAVYSLRAQPVAGQRVSISLTPELQHGELRNRVTGSEQGIFLITPSRERETYDQLMVSTELAAGELLVMSCLPDVPGSLGYAFHGLDREGSAEQKLLLVRLLQVPKSEILADVSSN